LSVKHGSIKLAHVRTLAQLPAGIQCPHCIKLTILDTGHMQASFLDLSNIQQA